MLKKVGRGSWKTEDRSGKIEVGSYFGLRASDFPLKKIQNCCAEKIFYYFCRPIVRWCNWQHVWFWSRRVQVRALVGQLINSLNS